MEQPRDGRLDSLRNHLKSFSSTEDDCQRKVKWTHSRECEANTSLT